MNHEEAQDTIYQCIRLLDSVEALLERARIALEMSEEYEIEFTPWADAEVIDLDDYRIDDE